MKTALFFGARNQLTEREFKARRIAAEQQRDEDNADFDFDNVTPDREAQGQSAGPESPPLHWLECVAMVDDPKTYTRPFTIEFAWRRDNNDGIFEYACHEGNHSLFDILSGARADDREAAASSTRP